MAPSLKELHRLMRNVERISNKQATISDVNWDASLNSFTLTIRPNDGLYEHGKFDFEITLQDSYPDIPPVVWCNTDIYHPNIDTSESKDDPSDTNVCLNLLAEGTWSCKFGLEGMVHGLLFLMHHPNINDPLSPYFDSSTDMDTYEDNVGKYMAGEAIDDGSTFETGFKVTNGIFIDISTGKHNGEANEIENYTTESGEMSSHTDSITKAENTPQNEVICPDNCEETNTHENDTDTQNSDGNKTSDPNQNNDTTQATENDDIDDSFPVMVVEFGEEFVLMVDSINDNCDNASTNVDILNEQNTASVHATDIIINTQPLANDESNDEVELIDNSVIEGKAKHKKLTCGLWNVFKTGLAKLLQEIITRGTKNDVIL